MDDAFKVAPAGQVVSVGRVPFHVSTLDGAARWLDRAAELRQGVSVRLANAYCVALADERDDYRALLVDHGVNFPDGTPVVWFMRRQIRVGPPTQGSSQAFRVRGPSLFLASLRTSARTGRSVFFLGASPETLAQLTAWAAQEHPGLRIVGSYSPPFAPVDDRFIEDCAQAVQSGEEEADIVWVGLGTPKQDFVSTALAERLSVPCVGVGAAFDFAAGSVREAPLWIQNSGLEWLYRLASEPRRLWRRYVFGNVRFIVAAVRYAGVGNHS